MNITIIHNNSDLFPSVAVSALYNSFINTPINTKVLDIVKKIKSLGLNTAMITDNKSDRIKNIVAYHKWERLFDCFAVSAEIGAGKSSEKNLILCLNR